ncbi:MAG: phosphoribosylamine--glycine ligase [Pseudomonadota bacterium]
MKILLVGSGGREHSLAWALAKSPKCDKLFCAPGNAGIAEEAECVDIAAEDIEGLVQFVKDNAIDFVVVGPEQPLVAGLGTEIRKIGVPVFGPDTGAAELEGSKGYMKDICAKYNIPTAKYKRFNNFEEAKDFIKELGAPIVIKTDGLAAGKGVIIAQTEEEAIEAVKDMLDGSSFGSAGNEIVIEEFMDGEELSYFALSDGKSFIPFTSAQDHKRVFDGDQGPNTGGMGAYSPAHFITPELENTIIETIIKPTVAGMEAEGRPFAGVLFAGLMVVKGVPKLIEYNIRFGDPECQPMLMRLKTDLVDVLYACATETLSNLPALEWDHDATLCVVMAANGYPGSYEKGTAIKGTEDLASLDDVKLFHAGTLKDNSGTLVNTGGRVLNIVGKAGSIQAAQERAYKAIEKIDWPDGFCRSDIGWRAIAAQKDKAA